jgi:hypothetical protein
MNRACFFINSGLHEQKQHASSIRPLVNKVVRMKAKIITGLLLGGVVLSSCLKDDNDNMGQSRLTFEFNTGTHGWKGDFADYPVTDSVFYELQYAHVPLPAPLNTSQKSLKISGNNHSDDLFMFIKRKVSGLRPNTPYDIAFGFEVASKAPTNAVGVGGAPGESVVFKVGATTIEPKKVAQNGDYLMNIDKGNQTQSGNDMKVIGHVGVSDTTTVFTLIKRTSTSVPIRATTDDEGSLWVIIGTESGFEATSTLYFRRIELIFK